MPFPRPIDENLHAVTDYTVGTLLVTVLPRLLGVEGTPTATQMRAAGASHIGYSTMTDYPLGATKVLSFQTHLALDALGALGLAATPFVTGQYRQGRKQWLPHVALAAFEVASLLMTDPTGRGDYHGNVEAVREANALDPERRLREGGRAVAPGAAVSAA